MDRNVRFSASLILPLSSLSARRAWIEICRSARLLAPRSVALRKESVDRNLKGGLLAGAGAVALRKESVDRNSHITCKGNLNVESLSARRAWIEIGTTFSKIQGGKGSLSARRAWIEIIIIVLVVHNVFPSLSARRAWIEIDSPLGHNQNKAVALRKESVDRNPKWLAI